MLIDALQVGSKVRVTRAFPAIGVREGEVGWVYEAYTIGSHRGVSVIFENGGYDGFGQEDADLFLEDLHVLGELYSSYTYNHISDVTRDYRKGFWRFQL
jgi:hypothetical protein